jgi:hypothetical protein
LAVAMAAARRIGIDGPTIARLVARAQRTGSPTTPMSAPPTPRWLTPLREQIARTNQGIQRATGRVETLGPADVEALLGDVGQLLENVTRLMLQLQGGNDEATGNEGRITKQRGEE